MSDLIDRRAAIDAFYRATADGDKARFCVDVITSLPSAQPERLTDDDFETIRIHLSAYKENLCNQHRWKEAEEYQRIIDRFMGFASAQPEITEVDVTKYCRSRNLVVITSEFYRKLLQGWQSAQPEQLKGEGIKTDIYSNWNDWTVYTCSKCGCQFKNLYPRNFCSNCGAANKEV